MEDDVLGTEIDFERRGYIGNTIGALSLQENYTGLEGVASQPTLQLLGDIVNEHPGLEFRVEQAECLDAIKNAREQGVERALVQMATGLGKTTVVAADVKRFLDENPNSRVLFLCHQNDILTQAKDRFAEIIGPEHTYGDFTGEAQDYHEVSCLFASFQAMRGWREAFLEDEFDYIVVDESHHAMADTYRPTLEYFKPQFLLGVTATPDRLDLRDIRQVFGEEIYSLSLEEAIAEGLLAAVDYRVITDEIETERILKSTDGKKLSIQQLNRSIFVPKRDEEIAQIIQEHSSDLENPKRIIFCASIEHAEEFAQYFDRAAPLHTRLPAWEQNSYIDAFKNGTIDTILAVNMFNEGIDVPDANQIIFLRATQSKTIFLQQLGRGLRRFPGKDSVQVLDFVANCERLTMLDEVWKDIQSFQTEDNNLRPDLMRIDVGGVHFNEVARDVLDILDDIEQNRTIYKNWTRSDSVSYYQLLSHEVGHPATPRDIKSAHEDPDKKGPPLHVLTRGFDLRLQSLREACGFPTVEKIRDWSEEQTIAVYNQLSQGRVLGVTELRYLLKQRNDLPGITKFLEPFGNSVTRLQLAVGQQPNRPEFVSGFKEKVTIPKTEQFTEWSAEDSMRAYRELSPEGQLGRTVLQNLLANRPDLPGITRFLKPFEGNFARLETALGFKPRQTKWGYWSEQRAFEVYAELSEGVPLTTRQLNAKLQARPDLPSINIFLSPFSMSIKELNERAGTSSIILETWPTWSLAGRSKTTSQKPRTQREDWTANDSVEAFRSISADGSISATELERTLREDHPELPSIRTMLKPFNGRMAGLLKAAGFEPSKHMTSNTRQFELTPEEALAIFQELSQGKRMKARDLEKVLSSRHDLPSIKSLLLPFNGKVSELNRAAGY